MLGKGGTGRSTVAAAFGLALARAGRRTLLVEVAGQERLSRLFATAEVGYSTERELAPGLFGLSIDPESATEEYLARQLRVRPVVELLVRSRAFSQFTAAAPGLAELVTVGKIWTLATQLRDGGRRPVWDNLVVDLPATGHGIALLETAGNVRDLAAAGPIADQAAAIQRVVTHPAATGVAVVARPDELAVTEALESAAALRERGLPVALAVLNAASSARFSPAEEPALSAAARAAEGPAREAVRAALAHLARQAVEAELAARLRDGAGVPLLRLPRLVRRRFDVAALDVLADAVTAELLPGARNGDAG